MECGSWWCKNPIKQFRKIDGIIVCRPCYQYVWERAKKLGEDMAVVFRQIEPPKRVQVKKRIRCSRSGCNVILNPRMDSSQYRWIGVKPVCRNCYETAWEHKEKHGLKSMQEAFDKLYPKGWRPPEPDPVKCAMPWCKNKISPEPRHLLEGTLFVCGLCRTYLNVLGRRHNQSHDWKWYAQSALRGMVPAPGTQERCGASWCGREIKDGDDSRGPNGEALCNTDRLYFYNYARRNGITFDDAFRTAPPPRLLHVRVH